ncbi:MAG: DUF4255 domain-containing protein [Xanthomonadales bacterium]|nr:DUF4255 domain-containing protein [Xanthomonadales bacterium]
MPDFTVIADVSSTLQAVLTDALSTLLPAPAPVAEVHDLSGNVPINPPRLTIFLFEVVEDPSMRNRPHLRGVTPPDLTVKKPPMALLLRYLMTPWSGDRITDHRILGRTLQTLYDGSIISGPQLQGGLAGTSQALKITLAPLNLDERSRVWYAIQQPYRLSVTYEIRVVNLDAVEQQTRPPIRSLTVDSARPGAGS